MIVDLVKPKYKIQMNHNGKFRILIRRSWWKRMITYESDICSYEQACTTAKDWLKRNAMGRVAHKKSAYFTPTKGDLLRLKLEKSSTKEAYDKFRRHTAS